MKGAVTRRGVKYVRSVTGCRLWDPSHRQQAVIFGSRLYLDDRSRPGPVPRVVDKDNEEQKVKIET